MTITGPDFIALQVRDIERSATFYEDQVGMSRAPQSAPGAIVFATDTIPFAVREPAPGVDLDAQQQLGAGIALWLKCADAKTLHDSLKDSGVVILRDPAPGPFGLAFTFVDPDGYAITMHEAR